MMRREGEGPPSRRAAFDRDWTQGSEFGNLFRLAWPVIVSSSLQMLGPTIDMIWVGRLGSTAIAGVGVAGMAVMLVNSARMGLTMGMRAILARAVGAGDMEDANHVAQQAFVISLTFAITLAAIGIFLADPIMRLLGVEADVAAQGAPYMRIMFVGSVFMSFGMVAVGTMQASGDTITPMKITLFTRFSHVGLAPFLIFGWWIFPRLGISGAALTNVICQALGLSVLLWVLFSGRSRIRLSLKNFRLDFPMIWRMIKIGIPASLNSMERSVVNLVMMKFIVAYGTLAVAAHTLMQRIEAFLHMPTQGFGQAAGVLAAQNLGAEKPERAERTGWIAAGIVTIGMLLASVVVWFWAEHLVRFFNPEPGLVVIGSAFLRIQIVGNLMLGLASALTQCLNGVGDTLPPLIASLITMWGVQIPMAYYLPKTTNLGVYGIRWAMVTALVIRTLIYTVYFKLGRWKRKQV